MPGLGDNRALNFSQNKVCRIKKRGCLAWAPMSKPVVGALTLIDHTAENVARVAGAQVSHCPHAELGAVNAVTTWAEGRPRR